MFLVEIIRKSNGKVTDRFEVGTYDEVLSLMRTINTKIFKVAIYS